MKPVGKKKCKMSFEISPKEYLPFELLSTEDCKASLRVSNNSDSAMAFKVKTTQPNWYIVRPNQDVIGARQSLLFEVSLVSSVKDKLIHDHENGQEEDMTMHRFLIQGAPIDAETFQNISNGASDVKSSELVEVWSNATKEGITGSKNSPRLKVNLIYIKADEIEEGLYSPEQLTHSAASTELESLKKKYVIAADYTTKLTQERNVAKLKVQKLTEDIKTEERNAAKVESAGVANDTATGNGNGHGDASKTSVGVNSSSKTSRRSKGADNKNYSLFIVLIVMAIAYAAGRFLARSPLLNNYF